MYKKFTTVNELKAGDIFFVHKPGRLNSNKNSHYVVLKVDKQRRGIIYMRYVDLNSGSISTEFWAIEDWAKQAHTQSNSIYMVYANA